MITVDRVGDNVILTTDIEPYFMGGATVLEMSVKQANDMATKLGFMVQDADPDLRRKDDSGPF